MISWEVWFRRGEWGLYLRNYFAQGINPDYHLFKPINRETALYLVTEKLAGDLYGQVEDIIKGTRDCEKP